MSTKVKGLLKGLRYISQIFENEKEPDIQIGFPTDVKHVAHIGWDGPSATTPTWMTDYKSDTASAPLTCEFEKTTEKDVNSTEDGKPKEKSRRRRSASGGAGLSADNPPDAPRHSRRHHSSGGSIISDNPDPSGSTRSSRRRGTQTGPESDGPGIPKQSRRKKSSRGTSGGGSTGGGSSRSRSKLADADNSSESGSMKGNKQGADAGGGGPSCHISVLEPFEEEKECDEISKKLRDL